MMIQHQPFNPSYMPVKPVHRIVQSITSSPLGDVLLAATEQGLVGVWFVQGQLHMPASSSWVADEAHPTLIAATQQLHDYFAGRRQIFDLPIQPAWGTPFQRTVWKALQHIPYGRTRTYGDIARDVGKPNAVRAVGAAIGQNPHTIIVPCHRVVGTNGSLTGFAGGLPRKQFLLAHETTHT